MNLTAVPNPNWVFQKWEGGGNVNSPLLTLIMNSNQSVVGVFVRRDYPLNITIEGEGTVEERIVTNPSGREYPHGTTVELTPKPKEGWVFDSWGGDLNGSETPKNVTVDKEKNVVVKFTEITENPNFYLHENGETCMCPNSQKGEKGILNGIIYESVDNQLLRKRIEENADLTKLCTSLVTDLSVNEQNGKGLFGSDFNQDIGGWDVSNVTDMSYMFSSSRFNKKIENWDVSNVKDMTEMFAGALFNQTLESWDVSNVESMNSMFLEASFQQPIGKWNVGNVKDMRGLFSFGRFNQPIGDWDVSNVTDISEMFTFNYWFNQPIGSWDVSSVENMNGMFNEASNFNQNISNWCVPNIKTEPENFSTNSPLASEKKPKWGTCQSELLAPNFHNTVWVGDESYEPCDCGFSGIIGFNDYVIYELGEFGSKEPTGCFPYNFWYRDENSKVENLKIEENKISFNLKNNIFDFYTEIELINEKLVITTKSDVINWIQKYNKSSIEFTDFCK